MDPCAEFDRPAPETLRLEEVLKALGDPDRLAIVQRLAAAHSLNCRDAAPGVPKATLSRHFKALRAAGLVETRRDGVNTVNRLRRDCLDQAFPGLLDAILAAAPHLSETAA